MRKTYLFATDTEYAAGKLTGAHRRFLELVSCVAKDADVIIVSYEIPQLSGLKSITWYPIDKKPMRFLPKHLEGAWKIYRKLVEIRGNIRHDYAVSFSPIVSICYGLAGIGHIISLFREDLIGYQKALQASGKRLAYFSLQERMAVKVSEKIIVQCENDCRNLIDRNRKYCSDIEKKTVIQINNANASWMRQDYPVRDVANDIPRILFIGNFNDRRKGHGPLLKASSRLLEEGYQFEILMAGDGAEVESYKCRYEKYSSICFLGRVTDMDRYLQQSDFEVVPSLIDSCPNTVLEGLNAGIAVYGANTGGIPDLLKRKEYLFEPDADSIYCFLKQVLENKAYILDGKEQRERRRELTFDWGRKIQGIIEDTEAKGVS